MEFDELTCETCAYFSLQSGGIPHCYRYPMPEVVTKTHSCGEHSEWQLQLMKNAMIFAVDETRRLKVSRRRKRRVNDKGVPIPEQLLSMQELAFEDISGIQEPAPPLLSDLERENGELRVRVEELKSQIAELKYGTKPGEETNEQ